VGGIEGVGVGIEGAEGGFTLGSFQVLVLV
jgi:hypothetical protein